MAQILDGYTVGAGAWFADPVKGWISGSVTSSTTKDETFTIEFLDEQDKVSHHWTH